MKAPQQEVRQTEILKPLLETLGQEYVLVLAWKKTHDYDNTVGAVVCVPR